MRGDPGALAAIGGRIKAERRRQHLTLRVFAGLCGVGYAAASMWESGKRDPGVGGLICISRVLGVPVSDLLGEAREREFSAEVEGIARQIAALAGDRGASTPRRAMGGPGS